MEFRIVDTFTNSLAKLTAKEQKAVKSTAFDLQIDPANPGIRFHKLDRVKDPNFWSASVNMDLRAIVHRSDRGLLWCYVGHHDDAYAWAQRRKIERHPTTGAAQLVEVQERVEEVVVQKTVERVVAAPALFAAAPDDDLLGYGVPPEWLPAVKTVDENGLFEIVDRLPQEAAEALLELATGSAPPKPAALPDTDNPFAHPDAQRRFRTIENASELERALNYPWEKWTVFLHPVQRELVERA